MADDISRNSELHRLVQEFQTILEHYHRLSPSEHEKQRLVEVVELGLFYMTKKFSSLGYECPVGREQCPGGGCVPQGRACRDYIRRL